ncbi:ABC transporter ATP-binding protein [Pseudomonas sp. CFBP 8770]|uniref:ABC transporter ATP-binding protein n=1 Tax=unclassified Pseudomonas TaxID=196821 RepID=UPI001780D520|nr:MULTISPECIES: ABC transporter ATP-binding protein [unclassified Pseudomonas]MBD8472995.1 ABC transporter ATP-binding protein [Pseudomonas sp. CFBP 8773]MBD8645902.1 ABC transporter ATP-binding protein [Pseudomonas sp. CFBP 8770]MBD8680266.1 ABC transporter ATP-binding protein [Pseudomonas sp. CFBP 13719]
MLDIQDLLVQRGHGAQAHRVCLPSLQLGAGEILAITGESGCGKSTLLEAIGLLLAPSQLGQFRLGRDGLDIGQMLAADDQAALTQVRSRDLGFILQSGGLLPFLKVRDNISLPRRLLGMSEHSSHVEGAIGALRLDALLDKLPHALSIGERQRVACVRAIAHEPQLLLADEPTAALDPHSAQRLFELLLSLVAELGLSALVVSHDWALVRDFGLNRMGAISHAGETRFEPMD